MSQAKNENEAQDKVSFTLIQDELSQVKSEKASLEKDFMERLGEYEKNFGERMEEYEKKSEDFEQKIAEYEKTIADLNVSVEKYKEQMAKMKRLYQTKLKAAKEEQKDNNTEVLQRLQKLIIILTKQILPYDVFSHPKLRLR